MAPQSAGEWGSGVALSVATVGAGPTPSGYGCAGGRDVGISRWPVPVGGARECGVCARSGIERPDRDLQRQHPGRLSGRRRRRQSHRQRAARSDRQRRRRWRVIGVNDFNTVTNSGTLTAGPNSTGIFAGVNNTIVNAASGVITLGDDSLGIFAAGNSTVTNAGQITIGDAAGLAAAIIAINDDNTVSNLAGATITVGLNAVGILMQGNRAIVNNAGTINAGRFWRRNRCVRRRCADHEQRFD